jgi:hypothetical protein
MTYPVYQWIGEEVSALLGALYGKLVLNFGHVQAGRLLTVPSIEQRSFHKFDKPPFNDQPRKPNGFEPNLAEAGLLLAKYTTISTVDDCLALLVRAADLYRLALETYDDRPEVSFAMLISTLEVLTGLRGYSEEELYDECLLRDVRAIQESCPEGHQIARRVRARLYQVKRKVAALVRTTIPETFFQERETTQPWGFINDRTELVERVRAAYDVRSRLLHTGNRSGLWYIEHDYQGEEYGLGTPVLDDRPLVKLLCRSVNLVGLERITSTVLRTMVLEWVAS